MQPEGVLEGEKEAKMLFRDYRISKMSELLSLVSLLLARCLLVNIVRKLKNFGEGFDCLYLLCLSF